MATVDRAKAIFTRFLKGQQPESPTHRDTTAYSNGNGEVAGSSGSYHRRKMGQRIESDSSLSEETGEGVGGVLSQYHTHHILF